MDWTDFLPPGFANPSNMPTEAKNKLKERMKQTLLQMHELGTEVFRKSVYKRKLEESIKYLEVKLPNLKRYLFERIRRHNQVAEMLAHERERMKNLKLQAQNAMHKMTLSNEKIAENRRKASEFSRFTVQFHEQIENISTKITGLEDEMRQYREKEGELVKLNVELANYETELNEVSRWNG